MAKPLTRLEAIRRGQGISQQELVRLLGLKGNSVLAQIENRKLASYPKIRKNLAAILDVDEQKLFDERGFAKLARQR